MFDVHINGKTCQASEGQTILEVCKENGIYVPTLCYHADLSPAAKCFLCIVKTNDSNYCYACVQKVHPNMTITTNSHDVLEQVKKNYANFVDMSVLPKSDDIEALCDYLFHKNTVRTREYEKTNSITFKPEECINCWRCVRMCSDMQNIGALTDANPRMKDNECISCGQCVTVCPTTALQSTSSMSSVFRAIVDQKVMVLQTAPSVRVAVGEIFGDPDGTISTDKLISAARRLGFKYVFDSNFGADVTVIEEGTELIHRLQNKEVLPMFTSCCPAWVNYVEKLHQELIPNLSTTKSPHMIVGRLVKTYWASKMKIDPRKIFLVSLMPCVAKKDEIKRMQFSSDVDAVLTTVEFGEMIKLFGIDWNTLNKLNSFDDLLGDSTGGAALFGVTGGVCEASVRFAHEAITGEELNGIEYSQWRGMNQIKSSQVKIGNMNLNIAVCSGISAAIDLIETRRYLNFHFIEVMACPCGCIGGAGQPKLPSKELLKQRAKMIYDIDQSKPIRVSSGNPQLKKLYSTFLHNPGGHLAHELLHTHYEPQETTIHVLAKRKKMKTMPIVAYGSSSGNAMNHARIVASTLGSLSVSINSLTIEELIKRRTAIFVISTIGEGEIPSNAKKFVEELMESYEDLKDVKYAVVGLGSHHYKKFCEAGKQLNTILEQHNGSPILPLATIDVASEDRGEESFERWVYDLCSIMNLKMPRINVKISYHLEKIVDKSCSADPSPISFHLATVKRREELTADNYEKRLTLINLELPHDFELKYGNNIEVFPENPPEMVEKVLKTLKLDPSQIYNVITNEVIQGNYIPEVVTIKQLFAQYLDLSGAPNRNILRAFLQVANREGSERLEKLLNVKEDNFTNYVRDTNTGEFILEFVTYGIPSLDLLVSSCHHTKPRIYSVASSVLVDNRHLTVLINKHTFGENDKRSGMCSSYLANPSTLTIPIRKVAGPFFFPKDEGTPMIFIALGGGIAPILALMEQRASLKGCGPAILFYGCRHKHGYEKVIDIIESAKKAGSLTDCFYAFSRESPGKKHYVQDEMKANTQLIWEHYWSDSRTIVYYSGHSGDIIDQISEILLDATVKIGGLNSEEAHVYSKRHYILVEAFHY